MPLTTQTNGEEESRLNPTTGSSSPTTLKMEQRQVFHDKESSKSNLINPSLSIIPISTVSQSRKITLKMEQRQVFHDKESSKSNLINPSLSIIPISTVSQSRKITNKLNKTLRLLTRCTLRFLHKPFSRPTTHSTLVNLLIKLTPRRRA